MVTQRMAFTTRPLSASAVHSFSAATAGSVSRRESDSGSVADAQLARHRAAQIGEGKRHLGSEVVNGEVQGVEGLPDFWTRHAQLLQNAADSLTRGVFAALRQQLVGQAVAGFGISPDKLPRAAQTGPRRRDQETPVGRHRDQQRCSRRQPEIAPHLWWNHQPPWPRHVRTERRRLFAAIDGTLSADPMSLSPGLAAAFSPAALTVLPPRILHPGPITCRGRRGSGRGTPRRECLRRRRAGAGRSLCQS